MKCPNCGERIKFPELLLIDTFDKHCHNLDGEECQGALAEHCISRLNGLPCPTYSKEELKKMMENEN